MSFNREIIVLIFLLSLTLALFIVFYKMQTDLYWSTLEYEKNLYRIHSLHDENMELKDYYLEQSSYTTIYKKAINIGFTKGLIITP